MCKKKMSVSKLVKGVFLCVFAANRKPNQLSKQTELILMRGAPSNASSILEPGVAN